MFLILATLTGAPRWLFGQDTVATELTARELTDVRAAVERAVQPLQLGMAGSRKERQCFTCHNHAIPVFALTEAERRGIAIDPTELAAQVTHTREHLQRGRDRYEEGKGQGGQVLTAGYALWTLEAAGRPRDEVTHAVIGYLLTYQQETHHWQHQGNRPPSSGSDFAATAVALRAIEYFAGEDQTDAAEERRTAALDWLIYAPPVDTEDHVFRLQALKYARAEQEDLTAATEDLLRLQREDGGWAQLPDGASDAYATATALDALQEYGTPESSRMAVARGARYLLETQESDGTWHVVTRAVPIQTYFESGFPHGRDQFISMSATAWSTLVLSRLLPLSESAP